MTVKLIIPGRLPGMNEYIDAERRNRYAAAKIKKTSMDTVVKAARTSLGDWAAESSVRMDYLWIEPNMRRDKDNVSSYGRKAIQDALVEGGYLPNDGWRQVESFSDSFAVDKKNPRIEVTITEL